MNVSGELNDHIFSNKTYISQLRKADGFTTIDSINHLPLFPHTRITTIIFMYRLPTSVCIRNMDCSLSMVGLSFGCYA